MMAEVGWRGWRRVAALALVLSGCSLRTHYAQVAVGPAAAGSTEQDAGSTERDAGSSDCPDKLADRLTIHRFPLDANIRYKRAGHDRFPFDERVGFAVNSEETQAYVAWSDDDTGQVRVTPLDANLSRSGPDVLTGASDVGGITATGDGFAVLVRRDDPGASLIGEDGRTAKAIVALRYSGGTQLWMAPLTGTASVSHEAHPELRDCAPDYLYARLAWNGAKYGAYFIVRGCAGDPHDGQYGDKFVYFDDQGRALRGGFTWGCSIDEGLRFVPEPDVYTTLCLSDSQPFRGLNLVVEGVPPRRLAAEYTSWDFAGGQFGSVLKLADGSYFVGWLSRDVAMSGSREVPAKQASDVAMLRLGPDYSTLAPKRWLIETTNIAETNLHFAAYGPTQILMVWDSIAIQQCSDTVCFGSYTGTHVRVLDSDGNFVTADELIDAPPNTAEDLWTFKNGDVGWAYVPDTARDYTAALPLDSRGVASVPKKRSFNVARLHYCE